MEKRKELILNTIIREHIKSGAPVGSEVLASKYKLGVSSATVRNEMADLEERGFIMQPHTSAGRVPTEKAYAHYLKEVKEKKLNESEEKIFADLLGQMDEAAFKQAAKAIAHSTGTAVFWAFHRHNLYYTGIANLLSQPEFVEANLIYDISAIIDRVDEIIDEIYDRLDFGPQILLGKNNPFSPVCSTILSKYKLKDHTGLFGILGPLRMNYEKNLALVRFINQKLSLA